MPDRVEDLVSALYVTHAPALYVHLAVVCRLTAADAFELTQETFIRLYVALSNGEIIVDARRWTRRSARSHLWFWRRRRWLRARMSWKHVSTS
jgi:DNA-directed RNA polymerase specialized sigma24 family protein